MPWEPVKLNDGYCIPSIAFGTWLLGNGEKAIKRVEQAISVSFNHIDTAQDYQNETEAGIAIRRSGAPRSSLYITTKYSGTNGLDIRTSIHNSLRYLGVTYVDLYLIHAPSIAVPDIPSAWKEMENIRAQGLAKSIGVSNFETHDLDVLLASAKIKPAANQILLHPYVYAEQVPLLDYCRRHGIVVEAYSVLIPITKMPTGTVAKLVSTIAKKLGPEVTADQVLLAWAKKKLGAGVVVTTSSKKDRLKGYLRAADILLSDEDIAAIDNTGKTNAQVIT